MHRRTFLARTAQAGVALATPRILHSATPAPAAVKPAALIGIQIAGHSLLDEGMERCLDLVQSTARANALFLYSHSHYAAHNRPPSVYADHGVPIRDERKRKITRLWVRHHDDRFRATSLRFPRPSDTDEYGNRDLFAELAPVCRQRGLQLYARILEPGTSELRDRVTHYERAMSVGLDGKLSAQPCRNNPEWQGFWDALVDDTIRTYPLDGYQWGAERVGPLSELLWRGTMPFCFCPHCEARARREGINAARARQGFTALHSLITGLRAGGARPPDGVFTNVLRLLMQFPEILAWDYQWRLALEEQGRRTHALVKAARPTAQVGRHFDHQNTSWDALFLAQLSYADVVPYTDFIKPILYHDILGPRLRWWSLDRLKQGPLAELSLAQSLDLFYALRGYDPKVEPTLDELDRRGLSADYVAEETRRIVAVVQGKCAVVPGIGVDVPDNIVRPAGHPASKVGSTPAGLRAAVTQSFAAGASGLLISREYDEMRVENLRAIGETLRDLGKA
jgi:hypothetical protein